MWLQCLFIQARGCACLQQSQEAADKLWGGGVLSWFQTSFHSVFPSARSSFSLLCQLQFPSSPASLPWNTSVRRGSAQEPEGATAAIPLQGCCGRFHQALRAAHGAPQSREGAKAISPAAGATNQPHTPLYTASTTLVVQTAQPASPCFYCSAKTNQAERIT